VTIEFDAKTFAKVQIQISDVSGKKVYDKDLGYVVPGKVRTVWEPKSLPAGAYYYRIVVGDTSINGELMMVK
jgi:flagellar hook assembly protein FlgD